MKAGVGVGGWCQVALGLWEVKTAWRGARQHEANRPVEAVPGSRDKGGLWATDCLASPWKHIVS